MMRALGIPSPGLLSDLEELELLRLDVRVAASGPQGEPGEFLLRRPANSARTCEPVRIGPGTMVVGTMVVMVTGPWPHGQRG
jgi:hypothetical protein